MSPTRRHQFQNLLQSILLVGGMGLLAWIVVSSLFDPAMTILIALFVMIGFAFAPSLPKQILLSSYDAKKLGQGEFPEGVAIIEKLATRAGLPRMPELYYIPSRLPNAFAVGGPDESAVCISDGLLKLLDRREMTGVLAHEMAHIAHRDLWIMGVADVMARIVSLASWVGQLMLLINLPLFFIGAAHIPWHIPLLLIFAPTLMALLQRALSRSREFDADRGAVELTGDPDGLAAALMKLERRMGRFWEDMFLPGRRIPEPSLLRTHPPTEQRVERLQEMSAPSRPIHDVDRHWHIPDLPHAAPPRFRGFGHYR